MAQDELLVIYSIAFPPGYHPDKIGTRGKVARLAETASNAAAWLARALGGFALQRGQQSRNAWGNDAYGLRLAIVHLSKLLREHNSTSD